MKLKFIVATTLTALFAAHSASAAVHRTGVITAVDANAKTFSLTNKHGRSEQYKLADHGTIAIEGKKLGIEALALNQQVSFAVPARANDYVKAEIVKFDLATRIAVVKPFGSIKTQTIQFAEHAKVGGKARSLSDLAEGQTIEVRFAVK